MSELKTCSRYRSTTTYDYFSKNRKDEWFKLCNNCRRNASDGHGKGVERILDYPQDIEHLLTHEHWYAPKSWVGKLIQHLKK